jgi:hypothetical protein
MKWLYFVVAVCGMGLFSSESAYILSRLYEGAFFYFHYNYLGLNEEGYYKEVSYAEKIVCLADDFSKEMVECLRNERSDGTWVFSERKNMKTYWIELKGKQYVVKRHIQRGFFKNIMQMGKCVSIWNNLEWAKKRGVSVVTPIAFYEKRNGNCVETKVVYRFEEKRSDDTLDENIFKKTYFITNELRKANVVHADLRRRNIVYSNKEDQLKLIDVELMHYYPKGSYVCRKRLNKEERWLLED